MEPDFPVALNSLGAALQYQGKTEEAISCFEKALQLDPEYSNPLVNLLDQLQQTCSWGELPEISKKLDVLTDSSLESGLKPAETPFHSLSRHIDGRRQLRIAKLWSSDISERMSKLNFKVPAEERTMAYSPIRIGYLSNDFNDHPTAHLMRSMFRLHNRNEFEVFCYSHGVDDGSAYSKGIQNDCDRFVDVRHMSHLDAAKRISQDKIDILVELKGFTKGCRLEICALRPAPIQVSFLGFPGTTGADFIDYIITDSIVTPEDQAINYTEKFVYMPHCYQINDHTQRISSKKLERPDVGLQRNTFVFASFNQEYKIEPVMFGCWMRILTRIPQSVLWLLVSNDISKANLQAEAYARAVNPERIVFANKLPKDEHLKRLQLADLVLDTRIYNGHTTTSDALWAGVPLVTVQGDHFASRVSSSLLRAVGMPELITHDLAQYEALATQLASRTDLLRNIRARIVNTKHRSPLFDTLRFVKNLEIAYTRMWSIYLSGERPRPIQIAET